MLIAEVAANLKDKITNKHQQKVNRCVSFHAIKTEALNLLFSKLPISKVLNKLRKLFLTNPTLDKKKPTSFQNLLGLNGNLLCIPKLYILFFVELELSKDKFT